MNYISDLLKLLPKTGWLAVTLNFLVIFLLTFVIGRLLTRLALALLQKLSLMIESEKAIAALNHDRCRKPLSWLFPAFTLRFLSPLLMLPESLVPMFRQALALWIIAGLTYLAIIITAIVIDIFLSNYDLQARDNLSARTIHTQLRVIQRLVDFTILVIALASFLMTFEKVREVGVSLLASAGVVGIIIGFSAQKCISTIIAGIQIALTQPIRLDDVVVVENEWGWIEEITLTYVVVRIWDLRRLVLPISYFIEKPFQNWTRVSADLLGSVFLYTDYTVDVEKLREKFKAFLEQSPLWDKKVCAMQVTNTNEKGMEIRALLSTEDSSKAFTLRCQVREELIKFLQNEYPASLPRMRVQLEPEEA
jgi:small-conductance mechanosensitive channel